MGALPTISLMPCFIKLSQNTVIMITKKIVDYNIRAKFFSRLFRVFLNNNFLQMVWLIRSN